MWKNKITLENKNGCTAYADSHFFIERSLIEQSFVGIYLLSIKY